jgi:hypothetical protein
VGSRWLPRSSLAEEGGVESRLVPEEELDGVTNLELQSLSFEQESCRCAAVQKQLYELYNYVTKAII